MSIQIADKDAKFFQELTIKNLTNRQAAIINKATVLANFDTANMNARQTAAVENAKAFLQMDLKNLTNEQVTKEELLEFSFKFLLDREPNTSILSSFELTVISRYFSDFEMSVKKWCSNT